MKKLLIVLGVVIGLSAIVMLYPRCDTSTHERTWASADQLAMAADVYFREHGDSFPIRAEELIPYLPDRKPLRNSHHPDRVEPSQRPYAAGSLSYTSDGKFYIIMVYTHDQNGEITKAGYVHSLKNQRWPAWADSLI